MIVIGLTGSFGTGKTFVASIFKKLGARVIDTDVIAHEVIRRGGKAFSKIIIIFGEGILGPDGEIDRRRLASLVFANKGALNGLNKIVHPLVIKEIKAELGAADKDAVVVIDAPLLIEARLLDIVDKLVVVTCPKKRQIERCIKKFRIKRSEVLKRIRSQMSMKRKLKMADFVVENGKGRSSTRSQARKAWKEIVWR